MADNLNRILSEAEDKAAEAGATFEVAPNPILEAVAKTLEAREQIRGLMEVEETEAEKHQKFTQAAKPFLGAKPPKDIRQRMKAARRLAAGPTAPLPAKFDLRDLGLVTPVRNQLSCGSCWDFSAVASIESAALGTGKFKSGELDLSEQEVLSCGQNGGCNGDWPETAFEHAKTRGLPSELEVPYRASSGSGRCYTGQPLVKIDGHAYIGTDSAVPTDDDIKRILYEKKIVVSVAVAVDNAWMAYRSGVFNGRFRDPDGINHAVDITGWEDTPQGVIWNVRNHWGEDWGEKGYMRSLSGANLIGFGAAYCWINSSTPPVPPVPPSPPSPPPPPIPPVPPVTPQVMDIVLTGSFPGSLGRHETVTLKGTATARAVAAGGDCNGCGERMPLGWSFTQWRQLIADIYAIVQSDPSQQIESAVLTIYGDIRAGKYGDAVAVALGSMAAVQALVQSVSALIGKYHSTSHGLQGSFFDWLGAHQAELIQLAMLIWRATHGG